MQSYNPKNETIYRIMTFSDEKVLADQLNLHMRPEFQNLLMKISLIFFGINEKFINDVEIEILSDQKFIRSLFILEPDIERLIELFNKFNYSTETSNLYNIIMTDNQHIIQNQINLRMKSQYKFIIDKIILIILMVANRDLDIKNIVILSDPIFLKSLFNMNPNINRLFELLNIQLQMGKIFKDSLFLSHFHSVESMEDEYEIEDLDLLVRLYSDDYSFSDNELIRLCKRLHFLQSGRYNEIIFLIKYRNIPNDLSDEIQNDISSIKIEGNNIFLNSCLNGFINLCKYFFEPNNVNKGLILALIGGKIKIIKYFVERNFINPTTLNNKIFIDMVIKSDNSKLLRYVIGKDTNLDIYHEYCLNFAIEVNSLEIVKFLVGKKPNINLDKYLQISILNGYFEMADYLIMKGGNINNDINKILRSAIDNCKMKVVYYLFKKYENLTLNINDVDMFKNAIKQKHFDVIEFLIGKGAVINNDILSYAYTLCDDTKILKYLLMMS